MPGDAMRVRRALPAVGGERSCASFEAPPRFRAERVRHVARRSVTTGEYRLWVGYGQHARASTETCDDQVRNLREYCRARVCFGLSPRDCRKGGRNGELTPNAAYMAA